MIIMGRFGTGVKVELRFGLKWATIRLNQPASYAHNNNGNEHRAKTKMTAHLRSCCLDLKTGTEINCPQSGHFCVIPV